MPSRGSYQITNLQAGKAAERDQSYRSCILTLIIFFFICIILIIAGLLWGRRPTYEPEYQDEYAGSAQHHHHHEHHTERTTTTTKSIKYHSNPVTSLNESAEKAETTISSFEVSTEKSYVVDATNSSQFEKLLHIETSTKETISTVPTIRADSTESVISTTEQNREVKIDESEEINTTQPSTTVLFNATITDVNFIGENTSSLSYKTTTDNAILLEKKESTTIATTTDSFQDISTHATASSTVEHNTTSASTTTVRSIEKRVCTTGECKNIASKMLFYMNHTIDACEDFYEYACGGFEANPQTIDRDLENVAYQRIWRQLQKELRQGNSSLFAKYYKSCIQYDNIHSEQRITLARKALDRVGKFYTTEDWDKNHTSFTELLAKLLLHNSALLFDVVPALEEHSTKQFTFKIGPTTYRDPFDTEETVDPCYANQFARENEIVDLGELYEEYKTCKNDTEKFIISIRNALEALGVFDKLNNTYNISQYVTTTVFNIDIEIMQNFFANYPSKEEIREAYLTKNYTQVTVETLDKDYKVVNWTQLIHLLTNKLVYPEAPMQVYFYDALTRGLKNLERFEKEAPMQLNNALLGLYARNLYHQLVLSKHQDAKEHCLRVATNLLIPEASNLYLSSFSKDQLAYMNKTIHDLFEKLKETLKLKIKEVEWATEEERSTFVAKIDDLEVTVPDISYFNNSNSTHRKTEVYQLSNNYFGNSVALMQRYRKLMYAKLFTDPGNPEQIWTHYATPFQSKGLAIYGLNLVVIPFGVIEWSTKYELSFDYIMLATLGNVIAHQIAHHFDANGIYYWNGTRNTHYSLSNEYENYINNQRNIFSQNPMSMTIPSTGQTVNYEVSQLTLNERLSEAMGLRLAYDTLDRLRSLEEVYLPWLELDFNQLFYLTYAQMHCTKSPLTSSYISLYENEQLPSRIHIFVSASNNRLLGEAWNCPEGSQIMPSYTCSPFPYLHCNEVTEETDVTTMRK